MNGSTFDEHGTAKMEAQSLSTCNQCGKKFQRKAHLLRHQQQHSGDRPYSCKFCSKTFKRSDVLRDHFSRCERRGTSAIPSSLERGRKRHACDECSRLKVKCDNSTPCRKCVEFGRKCVKSRPAASASSPEEAHTQPSTPDTGSDRNSIGFLLNCPEETDFLQEFPKSTTLSPNTKTEEGPPGQMTVAKVFQPGVGAASTAPPYQEYGHLIQEHNINVLLSNLEFQTFETQTNNWQMPGENMMVWSGPGALLIDRSVLERKAYELREKLRYTAAMQNPPHPPPAELLEAIELVTADNIASYIKLYFKHWHKHGPMIHEATFNPCTAAIPLLLALMSLGGMYSKETEDVRKLKLLLDTIESYVYSSPPISNEYDLPGHIYVRHGEDSSPEWQQFQLEELQGAYLMIVLQYWTGTPIARTRVRQQRFPRIAAIFHHLEVLTAQHPPQFEIKDQFSFRNWIRKESLIRLASLATMLDATFGMFNNVPTRFQWPEVDLPFPGDDEFFKIASFHDMITQSASPRRRMKVKAAFLLLFSPRESNDGLNVLRSEKLTAFDMQILIHVLYTYVWQSTFSNPLAALPGVNIQTLIAPFNLAMANWKTIWDEIRNAVPEEQWNKLGFQRTAETYYQAVESIVTVFEDCEGQFPTLPSDVEKGSHLKRLLGFRKSV